MSCSSCRFFKLDEELDDAGYCHRYPPAPLSQVNRASIVERDLYRVFRVTWPAVHLDDWCGEWTRAMDTSRPIDTGYGGTV